MDTQTRLHEYLSALADGELAPSELELAFAALDTAAGRQAWQAYHCIGEALRSEQCGHALSAQFEARLAGRLAQELPPAAAAPAVLAVAPGEAMPLSGSPLPQR